METRKPDSVVREGGRSVAEGERGWRSILGERQVLVAEGNADARGPEQVATMARRWRTYSTFSTRIERARSRKGGQDVVI